MEHRINHIIARVLSGESSSEDILSLSQWLSEEDKNREEFCRLKDYWDADVAFKHSVAPAFSADKLLQQLDKQGKRIRRRRLWTRYIPQIAAIALLFICSTVFYVYYTENHVSTYYTLLTDERKSSRFTLEDGSTVTLNKNSRVSYSNKYGEMMRDVTLEGEAYFEVAKDSGKPFRVELNGASVVVLGTHFNIKAEVGSDDITTTLMEGSIRFESAEQNVVMTPNQQLTFNRTTHKVDVKQVNADLFVAWKFGLLKYKSLPLVEIIKELQRVYKVEIYVDDPELLESTVAVSGTFREEQSLEQVLDVISRSLPVRWHNNDGVYYIQHTTLK